LPLAAAVLLLVPIWGFPYFLTQDGPTHVENAKILLDYGKPAFEELRVFYVLNLDAFPNWFSHLALAGLMAIVGPLLAEKLFLSAYVLLLPLAFRYALGGLRPEAAHLWPLILPFVYNHFLHLGFYNLAFAAVPFFLILGWWMRRSGRLGPGETAALGFMLLFLYFCHLVTLLLVLGALGLLAGWRGLRDLTGAAPDRLKVAGVRMTALGAAALPSLLLVLRFLAGQRTERSEEGPTFLERWTDLWRLQELASHDPRELWLTSALGVLLLGAGLVLLAGALRSRRSTAWDGLLLVAAAYAVVYFLAPVTVLNTPGSTPGGGTTHDRVSLYVFLALLLWLAAQELETSVRRVLVGASLAIAIGLMALRLPRYAEMNDQLREYLSVEALLPRHATLLPISFAHQGRRADGTTVSWRVEPFLHGGAYLAVERDLVDFTNYEADLGYFPTLFRPEANPYRWLRGGQETSPPCIDLPRYDRRAPRKLDFILVWGAAWANQADPCTDAILRHLEARYEPVATSAPGALARLYRRVEPTK
jgi:hypothetical protein